MVHLTAENGPDGGRQYPLELPLVVMGRHPDCDVVIDVGAVSRKHARISRIGADFFIEDLKSRNGTLLNNVLLSGQSQLADGDVIQVCDVSFVFRDERQGQGQTRTLNDSSHGAELVDDDPTHSVSTIMSKLEVSSESGTIHITASAEAKLNALIEITTNLGKRISLDEVLPQVLTSLFKIFIQADRGFVVLRDAKGNLIPKWTKLRRETSDDSLRISRTIVNQVIESKEAILSADAASDTRFQMSQSIADFRIRSMMCAPLVNSDGEVLGVLQIDTVDQKKRFQKEDLEVLASVAGQAGIAIENAQLYEQAIRQREVERDLQLAHQVQRGFLPLKAPAVEGYKFFDYYEPANQVGGDYYDYVMLPGGRLAVVVADVVGHGVAAALLMARLSSYVRFCLATGAMPAEAASQVNASLAEVGTEDRFITMVLGVLDAEKQQLTFANAGHMAPMLRRSSGEVTEIGDEHTGVPLGVLDDYQYEQFTVSVEPGDIYALYTDGINEAMNTAHELYSIERMRQLFASSGQDIDAFGSKLIGDVQRFTLGEPQNDDMCLVCFGRQ